MLSFRLSMVYGWKDLIKTKFRSSIIGIYQICASKLPRMSLLSSSSDPEYVICYMSNVDDVSVDLLQ